MFALRRDVNATPLLRIHQGRDYSRVVNCSCMVVRLLAGEAPVVRQFRSRGECSRTWAIGRIGIAGRRGTLIRLPLRELVLRSLPQLLQLLFLLQPLPQCLVRN